MPPASQSGALVIDLMAGDPIVVAPDDVVVDVARILAEYHVGGLPVVDGGRLIGVVSQTDLVRHWASSDGTLRWRGLRVRDVMTDPAVTIGGSASLDEAARRMAESNVARLVVVGDETDDALGVISESDLIRAIGR